MSAREKLRLCYCMNVFPGLRPEDKMRAFEQYLPEIRARLGEEGESFPAGLWLDADFVSKLRRQHWEKDFTDRIRSLGFYAFTANAFPYGTFHGTKVKTSVYRPDWSEQDRLEYTCAVADILAMLLPEDMEGSISTLPGGYARDFPESLYAEASKNFLHCADYLRRLRDRTGRTIRLAVEMEPDCAWESPRAFAEFYDKYLREDERSEWIGVCYDTCHQELLGTPPGSGYEFLRKHGIPVPKIQLSAALRASGAASKEMLERDFLDPVYLHQTRIAGPDGIRKRWADLPDALADTDARGEDWILHFHMPLFAGDFAPGLSAVTTELSAIADALKKSETAPALEIETYTYDVLPGFLKSGGRECAMAEEMRFAAELFHGGK